MGAGFNDLTMMLGRKNHGSGGSGLSAYEIAVKNGFYESEQEWLESLKAPSYSLTEADKSAIVASVIESLGGNPIFGYVDENNNIIVQGNLGDGTYSVKYEMEDGSTVDIGQLVLTDEPTYTNFADPTSADWKEGYRLTNSVDETTALTGGVVTNYVYPQKGDVIEVSGINIADSNSRTAYWFNSTDNNILKSAAFSASTALSDVAYDTNSMICTITSDCTTNARIRFSGLATGTSADVVIKIKQNGEYL